MTQGESIQGLNTPEDLARQARGALAPLERWAMRCHGASLAVVLELSAEGVACRVARGWADGVIGQHSWVVIGDDCYDDDALILDPTLWSYVDSVEGIWTGTYRDGLHVPHGKGSIWSWGRPDPPAPGREPFILTPRRPFSEKAQQFLAADCLGPLDRNGWAVLAHAPVEDWPAAEIIDAMCESGLESLIPIDIVGMLTDRNPGGMYLAEAREPIECE